MTVEKHLDLCVNHKQEWRHSHFAEHNCDYCKALLLIKTLREENRSLRNMLHEVDGHDYDTAMFIVD